MTAIVKFVDGPLAGRSLRIKRTPLFLRGTRSRDGKKFDALDQIGDMLASFETAFAYEACKRESVNMFICPGGHVTEIVDYRLCDPQPPQRALESNLEWREWCVAELAKRKVSA